MQQLNWDNPFQTAITNSPVIPVASNKAEPTKLAKQQDAPLPINPADKRAVNGMADINQLAPFKYPWAWDFFLDANKNHWTPLDINMTCDLEDYHCKLTEEERHLYDNVLAYLTTSDILAMRNIGLAVMEKMTAPELQIYQARQVYEESLHTWAYQHCIETLGLDQGDIYNRYRTVPAIENKIHISNNHLDPMLSHNINLNNRDELEEFVYSYFFFAANFEGCWFYNGFSPIFSLQRRGLMKGTAEQLQYIMRDEVMHSKFGLQVINTILQEEQLNLCPKRLQNIWEEADAAEQTYARYLLKDPILGYNACDHIEQFRFIANRRASQLLKPLTNKRPQSQLTIPFPSAKNALPWLDEQVNIRKEKNFFETRVMEYQAGSALQW